MAGHQRITASGVLGTSGKPQIVYSVSFQASQDGNASIILRNGTAATDTESDKLEASMGAEGRIGYGNKGKFFPSGCYVDLTNALYVDVDYEQTQST